MSQVIAILPQVASPTPLQATTSWQDPRWEDGAGLRTPGVGAVQGRGGRCPGKQCVRLDWGCSELSLRPGRVES